MTRRRRVVVAALLVAAGTAATGYGLAAARSSDPARPAAAASPSPTAGGPVDRLGADIVRLRDQVRANPTDAAVLARLGSEEVEQARITVDPTAYPRAREALQRSLALNGTDNVAAFAGMAAYSAALHDFTAARTWAQRGLAVDRYSVTLYGALADAETQLGHDAAATAAVQAMLTVNPGVPALLRAEYVEELHGRVDSARSLLERALSAASVPADVAYVRAVTAGLLLGGGDARGALEQADAGRAADPSYLPLLEPRARALAALGRTGEAVADWGTLVSAVPQPAYLVGYGELLDSLGRHAEAQRQYALFDVEARLFTANGVTLDTDPTLFYADHGDPQKALRYGTAGLRARPFYEMQDAYAWALHAVGRDTEALVWSRRAASLGTRSALLGYHRGVIEAALGQKAAAVRDLRSALATDPHFSPLGVPMARAALTRLGAA